MKAPRTSILVSLRTVGRLLVHCLVILRDARRGTLTHHAVDDRIRDLGQAFVRWSRIDLVVEGLEHLEPGRPYLFMSNHESQADIPLLFATVPGTLRMVAKKELFSVPIWGPALSASGYVAIDRKNHHQAIASLKLAQNLLREGISIWMAPEGTRSPSGELLPFKKGGFMLALQGRIPIVPVGLAGPRDVLPKHAWAVRLDQRVTVRFGPPIETDGLEADARDELMEQVRAEILRLRAIQGVSSD